jgi:tripartite-type tricarboxylate transporter receptor subunit TctC
MTRRGILCAAICALAPVLLTSSAFAQAYPNKPVRVVVPFAAGGPTDIVARLVAGKLSDKWGQQVYVENVVGASGNIGTKQVARSAPDGYTILVTTSGFVVNPSLYSPKPYDATTEFAPITIPAQAPNVMIVHPSVDANTVKEFIALVKANPGKYAFASAGVGQTGHLAGEFMNLKYGLDMTHVPFNGGGPIMNSMMGGHTLVAFLSLPSAAAYIKAGKVRALMVTTSKRSPAVPDVPTAREAGIPEQETVFFQGVLAPAGTPKEIIDKWHADIVEAIADPEVKKKLEASSYDVSANSPAEFADLIKAEVAQWDRVIQETKIPKVQ